MPIWGESKITWRQVLPPVLGAVAIACSVYVFHSCRSKGSAGAVRNSEQYRYYMGQIDSPDAATRAAVTRLLGELGEPAAVDAIRKRLQDDDPRVVGAACEALGRLGDRESTETLFKHLDDQNPAIVAGAVDGLGALRYQPAVEPILAFLKSPNSRVRLAAVTALGLIGDKAALQPLQDLKLDPCAGLHPEPPEEERTRFSEAVGEAVDKLEAAQ